MFNFLKKIMGGGPSADFRQLVKDGAMILDVRTPNEFAGGHIKGAINIPVDQLRSNLNKLKNKEQVIITCCASGMRSSSARSTLQQAGYTQVHNGGGWNALLSKIS
jgi:rhodanese-related sulfurtransferase